jgi:HD-GYP domain-containing protein (c-di-GMP phosphodiesterase class II)
LQHHENVDGSGYPDRLMGDEILVEAKVLRVADTVEAMTAHRPYRPAYALHEALEELVAGTGVRYDEEVVAACVNVFSDGFDFD